MHKHSYPLFVLSIFFLIACSSKKHYEITDLIQPINLEEKTLKEIFLGDLFYAPEYDLEFLPNSNVAVEFDTTTDVVKITPSKGFSGLDLLSFKLGDEVYQISFKLEKRKKYYFKYTPGGVPQRVNLFGQFNSWNRENLPMNDKDGDGTYEIVIPLDPGRYEYKFYVDGVEVVDSANPVKVPNGLGDYNSVRIIEKTAGDNHYLHVKDYSKSNNFFQYNFFYESISSDLITPENIIALINNSQLNADYVSLDGNNISIRIPDKELNGIKSIRIAINNNGRATNFQTLKLKDGQSTQGTDFTDWNDAIIYSIMIDRFFDGDKTNSIPVEHDSLFQQANYQGGDLQGIIDKLNEGYFDSLGINTIWISPIVDNTDKAYREYPKPHRYFTGYHGYWPASLQGVEERFGNLNLAKELVNNAHERGIKVLLDYVAHHVHIEHPLWKEHRDWFGVMDLPGGRKNLRLWDEYRLTTWFEPYMPSFDYLGSSEALELMTDNAVWWLLETGADGFRHDAVKHVPNEFWRLLTKKIKERIEIPEGTKVYQIGETFGGFDLISSYVNNGQLTAQFNFNLFDTALPVFLLKENSFELLDLQMQKTFQVYGVNHLMGNLLDSHDKIRYIAMADGDLEINDGKAIEKGWKNPPEVEHPSSYEMLKIHLAYLLTIPGIPVIYYGDEIGMTGAADPDNRRMMRFGEKVNDFEKETFKHISRLIHLRKEHRVLRNGDFYTLLADKNCYSYIRSDLNERILVVINKSEKEQTLELVIPQFYNSSIAKNLLDNTETILSDSKLIVTVSSIGYKIFKLQ
ncbi:MAG TPA: alpha-amylase family glycosyl hydrolase [Ignavibacteriaceae bacterium]|nr:alpha-amylase family glycosyl hydrolase [Ignavibacteriaceae bacterium]